MLTEEAGFNVQFLLLAPISSRKGECLRSSGEESGQWGRSHEQGHTLLLGYVGVSCVEHFLISKNYSQQCLLLLCSFPPLSPLLFEHCFEGQHFFAPSISQMDRSGTTAPVGMVGMHSRLGEGSLHSVKL